MSKYNFTRNDGRKRPAAYFGTPQASPMYDFYAKETSISTINHPSMLGIHTLIIPSFIVSMQTKMHLGKVIVGGVSIILVVGLCIGLIAGITRAITSTEEDGIISTSSKSVATICKQTDYKRQCVYSVASIANNRSATPKDYVKAAIEYTIDQVKIALNATQHMGNDVKNATQKLAVDDCQELLQFAIDELQASFSTIDGNEIDIVKAREAEIKNWLSAVMSYQHTCLDGLENSQLKNQMSDKIANTTKLTSNALSIISAISDIVSSVNVSLNAIAKSNTSNDVYPPWMSTGDRKLLASKNNGKGNPNAVVAQDGCGQFKTISAALAAYPKNLTGRYVVYVKAGIYNEYITVKKDQINVFMYGDGPRKTVITGHKSFKDGITTYRTASFSAIGSGFMAKSMGFQNTAGAAKQQAVALRVQSDQAAFYNCRMDGYQDTLYQQAHRQFFRNCVISGTVDFIFGNAAAIIQNSLIIIRKPNDGQKNTISAHGRADKHESTGLVIQNCQIVPEQKLYPQLSKFPSFLGRPRKQYSRTVIMESTIGSVIQPAGWLEWEGNSNLDTLYYSEFRNQGPGANTNKRVRWKGFHVLTVKRRLFHSRPTNLSKPENGWSLQVSLTF